MPLYPLQFEPIYKPKVWGGRTLEKLGRQLPGDENTPIGESWELADLATTSVSGGGGGEALSVVVNGPLAGRTLRGVIEEQGDRLTGSLPMNDDGGFPLLVKFLDAQQNLSVQVHPSVEYAEAHPEAHLKSEAWYILDAEPDAVIYKGVAEGTTPEAFAEAIKNDTVESLMLSVPARPGDCHYLPSGTCHALGAGILVAEVQTPSDTTFRVYDWGRTGRELHIDQALACIDFGPPQTQRFEPNSTVEREQTTLSTLVQCDFFTIERLEARAGYGEDLAAGQPTVWMVLEGGGTIRCEGGGCDAVNFGPAQTLLLPADLQAAGWSVDRDTTLLRVGFPQAEKRIA